MYNHKLRETTKPSRLGIPIAAALRNAHRKNREGNTSIADGGEGGVDLTEILMHPTATQADIEGQQTKFRPLLLTEEDLRTDLKSWRLDLNSLNALAPTKVTSQT